MRVRIWLGGVDVTSRLIEREWSVDHRSGGAMSTAKFQLHDSALDLNISRGMQVVIENWDDNTDRFFGGVLVDSNDVQDSGLGLIWQCSALDWMFVLERALVTGTWRGRSDANIINGNPNPAGSDDGIFLISETVLTDFDYTTLITTGVANTQFMAVQGENIRDVMDKLASESGYIWGVTPLKAVYYRAPGSAALTFYLSDNPDGSTSFHYDGYERFFDFTRIVNCVEVYGGYLRQLAQTLAYRADGSTTIFPGIDDWRASSGNSRIVIEKNTGTDGAPVWTAQDVGLAGNANDEAALGGTIEVLWDPATRTLRWATAPSNLVSSFRITGDILRPIHHIEPDETSIALLGRRYSITIRDDSITSEEEAILRASAELSKLSREQERHTLRTTKSGITAGSSIRLVNSRRSVDSFFLVERVEMHLLGGTLFEYEVTLKGL